MRSIYQIRINAHYIALSIKILMVEQRSPCSEPGIKQPPEHPAKRAQERISDRAQAFGKKRDYHGQPGKMGGNEIPPGSRRFQLRILIGAAFFP
jgi:hypothetical protein